MIDTNQARLRMQFPGEGTQEIELAKALITLGRRRSNDIRPASPIVSGQHAKIERTARGHILTDTGSTNGTFVNGRRLQPHVPHVLAPNDEIYLGQLSDSAVRLTYVEATAPASAPDETLVAAPSKPDLDSQETLVGQAQPIATAPIPVDTEDMLVEQTMLAQPSPVRAKRALSYGDQEPAERLKALEFERSIAVVIGINNYRHGIPPLQTPVNDARRLAEILHDDYKYETTLVVENVTLDRLRKLLTQTLPATVGQNDRVVFYFAGHGIALDGDDGPAGYMVPQDGRSEDRSTFLEMNELHDALMGLECRHMLIILDCCFAGAIRWSSTRDIQMVPEVIHQERYERFIRDPAWQVITSAAYDQKALDILSGDVLGERGDVVTNGHSPFALALFEALQGAGDLVPAGGGDGVITAAELYLYLRNYVEIKAEAQAQHFQTPSLWPLKKHDKGEYIFLVPGHELNLPPAPELTYENNPYRGLESFDEEHAELFFGRTELVKQLAETVKQQPLTVVLGASGTGKSSLVKAGLIPHLGGTGETDEVIAGDQLTDPWFILPPFRPTESPLRSLAGLLQNNLTFFDQPVRVDQLSHNPQALAEIVSAWFVANPRRQKLMLVIDQFEELVTLCRDEAERQQFLTLLSNAVQTVPDQLRFILTLRSDFEPQLADTALAGYWTDARFIVPPMSQAELREAIEGPASVRVLYFEPSDLIDQLIDEVIQTPGALPLLSFTLSEMYIKYVDRRSDNRALTGADYEALGGVIGSLRNRATEEYEKLDEAHRETMKRIMLRMIAIEGGELARRRVPRGELVYPDEAENQRVGTVLQRLLEARLIVGGETEGEAYVEPAHDALVRAWDKLLIWKIEAEDHLPLQRRLTQAANDWDAATGKKIKKNMLWHNNPRLPQLQQILEESGGQNGRRGFFGRSWRSMFPSTKIFNTTTWLNRRETDFIQQSITQKGKNLRRLMMTVTTIIIVLTGVTIYALIQQAEAVKQQGIAEENAAEAQKQQGIAEENAAEAQKQQGIAEEQRDEAERQANVALSRGLASQSELIREQEPDQLNRSVLLALESVKRLPSVIGDQALRNSLNLLPYSAARMEHEDTVWVVAFSPDGKWLATGSGNQGYGDSDEATGSVQVWEVETGQEQARFEFEGSVETIAFSSDGKWFAAGAREAGIAQVWEVPTWREAATMSLKEEGERYLSVNSVAFSPNGKWLATGTSNDNLAQVWEIETGQELARMAHEESVVAVAFSPDGKWLATGSLDNTARVWEVATGQEVVQKVFDYSVHAIAFSLDGNWLAAGSWDGTAQVWEVPTWREVSLMSHGSGLENAVDSVTFSPDGKWLATGSWDNTARVWETITGQEITRMEHEQRIRKVAFSPNGRFLATTSDDGTARVWDAAVGQEVARMTHEDEIWGLAFSPDGRWLATGSFDKTARVWTSSAGQQVTQIKHEDSVKIVAFSPNGNWLVISGGGAASVRETDTWQEVAQIEEVDSTYRPAVAFSSNGKWLATTGEDRTQVWEVDTWQEVANVEGTGVTFSSNGNLLATGTWRTDSTNKVWVWETATGQEVAQLEHGDGLVEDIDFSQNGKWLATSTYNDKTARVWDTTTWQEKTRMVHDENMHNLAFSPDNRWLATGSGHPMGSLGEARVWDIVTGQEVARMTHERMVQEVIFSSDSKWLVTKNGVWDAATGQKIVEVNVSAMAFSSDGKWLATGSNDNIVQVWEVDTWQEINRIAHYSSISSIAFSPDGRWLVTGDSNGNVRVWRLWLDDLITEACARLTRNLTDGEWEQYIGDDEATVTCDNIDPENAYSRIKYVPRPATADVLISPPEPATPTSTSEPSEAQASPDYVVLGDEAHDNKNYDQAIIMYTKAIEQNPNNATVFYKRGRAYVKSDALEEAIQDFTKATQLEPDHTNAWNNLCWYGSLTGRASEVNTACQRAVELDPDDDLIRDSRGLNRALLGDFAGAIEDFEFYLLQNDDPLREVWIEALEAGDNPFDEITLAILRNE